MYACVLCILGMFWCFFACVWCGFWCMFCFRFFGFRAFFWGVLRLFVCALSVLCLLHMLDFCILPVLCAFWWCVFLVCVLCVFRRVCAFYGGCFVCTWLFCVCFYVLFVCFKGLRAWVFVVGISVCLCRFGSCLRCLRITFIMCYHVYHACDVFYHVCIMFILFI